MTSPRKPPTGLAELRDMIVRREIQVSKSMEAVLRHLFENPADAAFGTCRSIAQRCNVSTTTVDRLAAALGFESFADFRDMFRQSLRAASQPANASAANKNS